MGFSALVGISKEGNLAESERDFAVLGSPPLDSVLADVVLLEILCVSRIQNNAFVIVNGFLADLMGLLSSVFFTEKVHLLG